MKKLVVLSVSLILSALNSGCSSSTSPGSVVGTFGVLQPGTRLTFEESSMDGLVTVWRDTVTDSVLATNLTFDGKSNVSKAIYAYPYSNQIYYYSKNLNGDLSVLGDPGSYSSPFGWVTLPCGSQASTSWRFDTTINGQHLYEIVNMTGAGLGTLIAGNQVFQTRRVKVDITVTELESSGHIEILTPSILVDVSPQLGWVVKEDDLPYLDDGKQVHEHKRQLIAVDY